LNRRHRRWAEKLQSYEFDWFSCKGSSTQQADILSRCPAFTSRDGGTSAAGQQMLLKKEKWGDIGAMQLDHVEIEVINFRVLEV
jgi:hypothetical protein